MFKALVETTTSNALISCDGLGDYDWSDQSKKVQLTLHSWLTLLQVLTLREHPEQPESVNDTYLEEQGDTNITIDSLNVSNNGEMVDQDDDDLTKERDLLASLIEKLKCEIDDSKNRNKFFESSNKTLIDKLKGEIKDFKTSDPFLTDLT
ncbi:hypothetical protein Tco_1467900 [Tanacetum coccineum]